MSKSETQENRWNQLDPRAWSTGRRWLFLFGAMVLIVIAHWYLHTLTGGLEHTFFIIPVVLGGLLLGYSGGVAASLLLIGVDLFLHAYLREVNLIIYLREAAAGFIILFMTGLAAGYQYRAWITTQREIASLQAAREELLDGHVIQQGLIAEARRQNKERDLLSQVHTALSRENDPQVIFHTVVESIAEAFQYRLVSVYKFDGKGFHLQHQVGYDQPVEFIPYGQGIVSRCVESGAPLLITDVSSEPGYLNALASIGSEVCVPLWVQGEIIGVLNIENERSSVLGEADLRMMTELGEYINISLERSRAYDAERQLRALAEALGDTARALNRSLDIEAVLVEILTILDRVIHCDAASLFVLEPQPVRLLVRDAHKEGVQEIPLPPAFAVTEIPILAQMAASGEPAVLPDLSTDPALSQYQKMGWIGSLIGQPVLVKGRLLGFLLLASVQKGFFQPEDVARLQAFVSQAGPALENARLFRSAQRQARYLEVLNDITKLGLSATSAQEVFQGLAGQLAGLIGADSAYITQWDEARQAAFPIAAQEPLNKVYPDVDVEPGEAIVASKVLVLEQTLVVEDVQHSPFLSPRLASQFPICSLLGVPLIADGHKLGAVLLAFDRHHSFTAEEVALCEQAAGQAALAVSKVLLIERIGQLAITDELTGLYNLRGMMELGRREVERALRFGRPLAAIMIDIDHFKEVNDRFGHLLGNQVLKVLSERCKANIREIDIFGRYGGEEFLVLLPENDLSEGRLVAERLRAMIAGLAIHTGRGDIRITVSLGVAEVDAGVQDLATLIERSDQAMYRAKRSGRNCVAAWESQPRLLGTD